MVSQLTIEKTKQFFYKLGNGFAMGAVVGGTVGLLFGTATVLITGPAKGKTYTATVGKNMLNMGGWFGCLMAVGAVIRADDGKESTQFHNYKRIPIQVSSQNRSKIFNLE